MPSKKGMEQAIVWLRSKAAEPTLDGINAELCLNVINDLREQNNRKGAIIHRLKNLTEDQPVFRELGIKIYDDELRDPL